MNMNFKFTSLFFFFFFLNSLGAKIVIVGCDFNAEDEFAFVSDEFIAAGTIIYFSEDEYDAANDQFLTSEGLISYEAPTGGLPVGRVIVIVEVGTGNLTADDGGTVTLVTGNWGLSSASEEIAAFSASNSSSPWNSITDIFCWFILDGGGGVGSNEDPSGDFPNCIVQDWTAQIDRGQYIRDRSLVTNLADIQNLASWSFGAPTTTMNSTDFTNTFSLSPSLPVTLSSFKVKPIEDTVQLLWETQRETNNRGFEIERSSNASIWKKIGFIEGNGNSSQQNAYSSLDENPNKGINYYRLKQIDFDGKFEYSNIVNVDFMLSERLPEPKIFPNPVIGNEINISFPKELKSEVLSIQLFSVAGRMIQQWEKSNSQHVILNFDKISNGIYFLEIRKGNDIWRERLILNHK